MPGQMAQDVIGSQRDLADVVTMVDFKATPFGSMCPKDSQLVDNLLIEWPVDKNEDPGDNAQIEGSDVEEFDNALEDYAVLQGRMQWFRRQAMVGKLAQNVQNQAGIKDKKAKAIAKKIIQLKRDMEIRFCGDGVVKVGTGNVPNKLRGLGEWIKATAQTLYPVDANYLTPAASIDTTATASITDAILAGVLTSQYNVSGMIKTYTTLCGTTFKSIFKNLQQTQFASTNVSSSIRTYNQESASKKIVSTVDIYVSDFGTMELVPSLWLGYSDAGVSTAATTACRAYNLDMENWTIRNKQMPQVMPLADGGGGPRFCVDTICSLICWNPKAEGKFAATS